MSLFSDISEGLFGENFKWSLLVFFIISIGIVLFIATLKEPSRDDIGCPLPLDAHTALLVDRSDPYSQRQIEDGRRILNNLLNNLSVNELFSYYEITGSVRASTEATSANSSASSVAPTIISTEKKNRRCRIPIEESEFNKISPYSVNEQKKAAEKFKKDWLNLGTLLFPDPELRAPKAKQPLTNNDGQTLTTRGTADSPIFEYIKQIANELHRRKALKNHLIIISDLGQNITGRFNICDPLPLFENLRNTEYYREVAPDLHGITVDIYYIQRLGTRHAEECNAALQRNPQHQKFWREYLTSAGATIEVFQALLE